jgi:hypothetical protein
VLAAKASVVEPTMNIFFSLCFFMGVTPNGERYDNLFAMDSFPLKFSCQQPTHGEPRLTPTVGGEARALRAIGR